MISKILPILGALAVALFVSGCKAQESIHSRQSSGSSFSSMGSGDAVPVLDPDGE